MNPLNTTIAWLTMRQLFAGKRIAFALAVALLPVLLMIMFRYADRGGTMGIDVVFVQLQLEIVVGTLLPLAALVFGTTAFGGEVEDGTLIYLLVKPVARWRVVATKYVVAALGTVLVMVPAVALPWALVRAEGIPFEATRALLAGTAVGAALYAALFVLLGLLTKRALVLGLVYVVGFEGVLSRSGVVGVRSLSVREFAVTVARRSEASAGLLGEPYVSLATVGYVGSAMVLGAVGATIWKLGRYQLAERV